MQLRPLTLAVLTVLSGLAVQAGAEEARHSYIVQLADAPVANYTGGVSGLSATKPAPGSRLDVTAQNVQDYIAYLDQQQSSATATVPDAQIVHKYKLVLNGFAARLTDAEVRALKKNSAVASISADEARTLDTNYTPKFLGLDTPGDGLWAKLGGIDKAGENVVIGIIDGGIWPEHTSYADRVDNQGKPTFDVSGTLVYDTPSNWNGACVTGEGFTANHCNNKLIGARYFNAGFLSTGRPLHWTDFVSPRDSLAGATGHGGHGDHTATTAGGNSGAVGSLSGIPIGSMSGMAPRARIAAYKVCWTYPDATATDGTGTKNSCYNSDSVAAIDQAVADGVNVLNYSISGSQTSVTDPVEMAFFNAAAAGVFVAASAGNSGPTNAVAHLSPWLTTVAASTHNRASVATVNLVGGASYTGASYNQSPLPDTATILARDAAIKPYAQLSTADKAAARLCYTEADRATYGGGPDGALDPAKASGKVLLCERGNSARVDKSRAVKEAGGAGMILMDTSAAQAPVADPHSIPTVHLNFADGSAARTWVATHADGMSNIGKSVLTTSAVPAPQMASFSSRGPNKHNANILKPDLTAPGVDILAGVTADYNTPAERDAIANGTLTPYANWASYQGTSMSSPHVAGLGALMRQAHPDWSPAAIKSALMTTAYDTFADGQPGMAAGTLPWGQGAGHVRPNKAVDPGLVYDSGPVDWIRFMCGIPGTLSASFCAPYGTIQSYNLNLASLTAASVLGKMTMTRTVTNVGSQEATYTANATLPGFTVVVNPSTLTLAPGAKASFTVSLTNVSAAPNTWSYGNLTWNDNAGHIVRSPLSAKPAMIAAPARVYNEAATGSTVFSIGTGFNGTLASAKGGLKAATRSAATIGKDTSADGGVAACRAGGSAGVKVHTVNVPANALVARFALYDVDTSGHQAGDHDDLDLLVLNGAGNQVGSSGGGTSNEMVTLNQPAAGSYKVCVIGYAPFGDSSNYTLSSWTVAKDEMGGNLKMLLPSTAFTGVTTTIGASWSGLASAKYLGAAVFTAPGGNVATTLLEVDTTVPVPEKNQERSVTAIRD
ncbi:S8 family serine peptidase [Duganella sp. Root1480D1]|uniref:S8 family serine peptidase n=1 Tax=Duganella sp. Root1480D1 TaxID=1736471 RepID=UPI00070E38F8|nr:S8 family serine peptidase [Duganella sp. Root1480D1]KQZ43780.1 peptidase S8 and S53 subtilisin kexin sedolisin [Duganella sp. Root1480D1]